MDLRLTGKHVFVAAASKGLGKASALAFAREGAKVTIASRNVQQLQQAKQEIKEVTGQDVHITQMDVLQADDIERAIAESVALQGGLDVLVTNAGGPPAGNFTDMDDNAWQHGFELNLLSTIRLIRAALPHLERAGEGRIVNIASTSIKQPIPGLILSNVFRAGVNSLAKTLATELAPHHILINTVAPGRIATDRIMELDQHRANERKITVEQLQSQAASQIPLGRMGTPEEFAAVVVFYGSFANTYVTGQSILVDGGSVHSL
ncbi:3-oxoacyl-[acyl-carrier-protein] reductase FabG [compost metagenome]